MVDIDTATKDFERFIEAQRVNPMKLLKLEDEKETFINLIENGYAIINDDGSVKYNLLYPVKSDSGEKEVESLDFSIRRIRIEDIEKRMNGKTDTENGRKLIGFLTKINAGLLSKFDADDIKYLSDISAFFLPR